MSSVLFIYPPISFDERSSLSGYCPPLGALYLGAILKDSGHDVSVIDVEAEGLTESQLTERVKSIDPDVVGLTCLTFTLDSCRRIIGAVRRETDAYVAVGGAHVLAAPGDSLAKLGADVCVTGEAETIITRIVEERPKGIVHGGEVPDIDSLPFPDRSLVEDIHYGSFYGLRFGKNMTGILTTRGCRYGCAYCNRPNKSSYRARSPKNILEELREIDRMGYDSVWLIDDNFTNDPDNVVKLGRLMKREKLKFHFFGQARIDNPSRTLYQAMHDMGVVGISYGVESLNPEVVSWYNKTHHPEKWSEYVEKSLALCEEHGIVSLGSLIFGAPMEKMEDMEHSIEFLHSKGADIINGNILLYLVGSKIWQRAVRDGKIDPDQHVVSAPEAGLTPYTTENLTDLCWQCTERSKTDGARRIVAKLLKRGEFGLLAWGARELLTHYGQVRKVRRELSRYGYGKKGYTTNI